MIYFYHGTNEEKAHKTAKATFDALRKKKPDATFLEFDSEIFAYTKLSEAISSQGLFENKVVVRLKNVLENEEGEVILKHLKDLKGTDNIIVWSEGDLKKAELEKIQKNSEKIETFDTKETKPKKDASIFALSDALGSRDKKKLWSLLVSMFAKGAVPEEIHGTLFWQVKSMLIVSQVSGAEESGLNPFVFSKAKGFLRNWNSGELKVLVQDLVHMYHKAHRGETDFTLALEAWVLGIK